MTPPRLIRYFATTDDSADGRLALGYLTALVSMAPVRVASLNGYLVGAWERVSRLLVTPLEHNFVNVVCAPPERWSWDMSIPMRSQDGKRVDGVARGRAELYTAGRHNVLLSTWVPIKEPAALEAARRYEAVVAPTPELVTGWARHGVTATLMPIPVHDYTAFRRVVMPDT